MTIIPGINNKKDIDKAFIAASEFLSALSWENNARAKLRHLGGPGIPENYTLKKAKCRMFSFPEVPFSGYVVGSDICIIPKIETEEQRNALILFREASSSNNNYLAFIFFWQILEIGTNDPIGWINTAFKNNRSRIGVSADGLRRLPLNGKKLAIIFMMIVGLQSHIFLEKKGAGK